MANIHLDFEDIRNRATQLTQREDGIKSDLNTLRAEIQNLLDTGFKTDVSSSAFGQRFEEFKNQADTLMGTLSELSNQLHQIVSNFADMDSSGA
jgi:WXG100 family type VII secretion target